MICLKLLWAFIQIGLFTVGGGYASLPLIQNQVVNIHGWITLNEFADIITIAEMTPGPIALNAATFVGTRIAGFPGAVASTVGVVIPSFIIVLTLSILYKKYSSIKAVDGILSGLRPAVVGLIASAGMTILRFALWGGETVSLGATNIAALVMTAVGVFVLRKFKTGPITIILASGIIGGIIYTIL